MVKITIHDVAREAGVSIATVYRAVSNSGRINPVTRQRILDTVDRLGYKPNSVARGLALRTRFRILVIMPGEPAFFWKDVLKGVNRAAGELSEYNVQIVKFVHENGWSEGKRILDYIGDQRIDAIALCIVGFDDSEQIQAYASAKGIPLALFNEDTYNDDKLFYYGPDNRLAGQMAAELMYRFCDIGSSCCIISTAEKQHNSTLFYRQEGFVEYIRHLGGNIPFRGVFHCPVSQSQQVVQDLLQTYPDLQGFYFDEAPALIANVPFFSDLQNPHILIGHEYNPDLEKQIKKGNLAALLVQEKVCQGYFPIKMLHQFIVSEEQPARRQYYSNINIIIGANLSCLQYEYNGCGYE